MPLIVNRQACTEKTDADGITSKTCTNATAADADDSDDPKVDTSAKYKGKAGGVDKSRGGSTYEEDTYSVFASFGGSAKASGDGGAVAVAQFFATGIAAQRLGANPSATRLISAATGSAAMVQNANEQAEKAEARAKQAESLVKSTGLTPKEIVDAYEIGKTALGIREAKELLIAVEIKSTDIDFTTAEKTSLTTLVSKADATVIAAHKPTFDFDKSRVLASKGKPEMLEALKKSSNFTVNYLYDALN